MPPSSIPDHGELSVEPIIRSLNVSPTFVTRTVVEAKALAPKNMADMQAALKIPVDAPRLSDLCGAARWPRNFSMR